MYMYIHIYLVVVCICMECVFIHWLFQCVCIFLDISIESSSTYMHVQNICVYICIQQSLSKSVDHGTDFKWPSEGGSQVRELEHCFNGIVRTQIN